MVPFLDLKAQYQSLKDEILPAVTRVLESGQYVLGAEVAAFEREFAAYCGTTEAVAVNTGTSALHLALLAAGVGPGDEVITVPFTFVATVAAIVYTGARPVFVDIDPVSCTLDAGKLESAITARTRAIIPVHLYGQPADLEPILEIAHRRALVAIEDAAQAHGAEYQDKRVGSLGDLGCFSFYPGKNLGACGEGGLVTTSNAEHARRLRMLRDWGAEKKYEHLLKGYNYRMEAIQGAVLRVKLRHLESWIQARRRWADLYDRLLVGADVQRLAPSTQCRHVYHIYAIRSKQREALQRRLQEREVMTGIHYPIPVHLQPAYADLGYTAGDFPCAEAASAEVLSLPMYPELTESAVEQVAASVQRLHASLPR